MLVFGSKPETLPVSIDRDASTGLPMLHEQDDIFDLILAYLALPYSVAEYGCGKKASLIIEYLVQLGIPSYALARGLIMERNMSPAALQEGDLEKRKHALVLDNPLHSLGDLNDPRLRKMLVETCPDVEIEAGEIHAGNYVLHHEERVQFAIARTHIFTVCTFWDEDNGRAVERVIDPTLYVNEPFPVALVREFLHSPDALVFRAPLLGHFRLDEHELTIEQRHHISELLECDASEINLRAIELKDHADLVRRLSGAEPGSIGDPETWTYANNITVEHMGHHDPTPRDDDRDRRTGRGDAFADLARLLIYAREERSGDVPAILAELRQLVRDTNLEHIVREDARWSEQELEVLADVACVIVYYNTLNHIGRELEEGADISRFLSDVRELERLRGVGVRLRRRIDRLGAVSKEEDGRIDARALTPGFVRSTILTIQDMQAAGLSVAVDRVGNLHGLLLAPGEDAKIRSGELKIADVLRHTVAHGSHIDTVNDGGKFDGRLGVLSGIETAHTLHDLEQYCSHTIVTKDRPVRLLVSAFIGEEMTFTGQGVSMPGSAAVAGRATPELIHDMTNGNGERWGDLLHHMLVQLAAVQQSGDIQLLNDLPKPEASADGHTPTDFAELLEACYDPTEFYSPHSYERHIEQGPILDRNGVPIVMVGTIMGIYQEDFFFEGDQAEAAALEMNRRLRELVLEFLEGDDDVRLTVGILEGEHQDESETSDTSTCHEETNLATRWTFEGEMNHAGATPTYDRRDPGVAAGRFTHKFIELVQELDASAGDDREFRAVAGNVRLQPGTNRNVIPGSVSFSLAVEGDRLDEEQREDLVRDLQAYAATTLAKNVERGGEGVRLCRMDHVSYIRSSSKARLSIDLRSEKNEVTRRYLDRVAEMIAQIAKQYEVGIDRAKQQEVRPVHLEESGQVLMMERSYGGSHNPRETELLSDLVRGCILQLAVSRELLLMSAVPADLNLFRMVESKLPAAWLERLDRFTSGALHDTCNIAVRALETRDERRQNVPSA